MLKSLVPGQLKSMAGHYRDPRYMIVFVAALVLFVVASIPVMRQVTPGELDVNLFRFINGLPSFISPFLYAVTQLGSLAAVVLWSAMGYFLGRRRAALAVALSGLSAWLLAKPIKLFFERGRPADFLDSVRLLGSEEFVGLGYPSGHAAVVGACAACLWYYLHKSQRRYLFLLVLLVGVSRVYLGGHFPRDIVGGWALGALTGAALTLAIGSHRRVASVQAIKKRLRNIGVPAAQIAFPKLDARGSLPMLVTGYKGERYFAKLFGKEEYAADWAFKTFRFFRYKRLGDEEPFLNSKRNVEHEVLVSQWARKASVRVADVLAYGQVGEFWMLVQEFTDGQTLDKLDRRHVTNQSLADVWRQINKLHDHNMAHRDLRAANVMIDTKGRAWLIDFGFAEVEPGHSRQAMDIAELLMSMSLSVGVKRTLDSALEILTKKQLRAAAAFVHPSAFSGATRHAVRRNREVYKELRTGLSSLLRLEEDDMTPVRINRFTPQTLFLLVMFAVFMFVILPQLRIFKGALEQLQTVKPVWMALLVAFSAASYMFAAGVIVALANVPLRLRDALQVQLASSFASKLLPGGLGGAALNIQFMRKSGMSTEQSAAVVVVARLLGFLTFFLPLGLFLLFRGESLAELLHIRLNEWVALGAGLTLAAVALSLKFIKPFRRKAINYWHKVAEDFSQLSSSRYELAVAGLCSLGITLSYIASLYTAMHAVGLPAGIVAAVFVFAAASLAGSAAPTPGGLGALELAMVTAMYGIGLDQTLSYSAVILYRLGTFWLPLPFGFVAYRLLQKRQLI